MKKQIFLITALLILAAKSFAQVFTTEYSYNTDHYECFTEFENTSADTIWLKTFTVALTGNWWNTTTTQDSIGTIINPDTSALHYSYLTTAITNYEIRIYAGFSTRLKVNPGDSIELIDFEIWPKVPGTMSNAVTIQPLLYTVGTRSAFTYTTTASGTTKFNSDTWRWQTTP